MGGNSATTATTTSPEEAPSSRSFFSRLSFLSRSRTRNLADFHIRPAEPHRKYSAGDHVAGAVVLIVVKPIRITHLTVTLHGFVKVHKGPAASHDALPINPTQAPSSGTTAGRVRYFGNGHASLFQDEQVLSADGKLEAGRYEFNFDLVFPSKGLPSSIDFERGTISYMITATLTRPTAISPVTTCDRKIYLVEKVDIGSLPLQRPRTISLEPISRRSKRRRPAPIDRTSAVPDAQELSALSELDSSRPGESVTEGSVAATDDAGHEHALHHNPRSPTRSEFPDVVSEFSAESAFSGSTGGGAGNRISDAAGSSSSASQAGTRTPTAEEKTITATVEMLKGGCLPGDLVPVKVSVHHIKRIKSVHGVIATLYRQGRIDSAPPIHLFTDLLSKEEMRRLEKEEYFPRSKTGLSGLSLSSAGSCSVFRKDLSQAFGPLIIDPVTLDASVTISVRLPEDVFPTIKGVPGELISFKYQLEVIVDLGGKLASQLQSGTTQPGTLSGATSATTFTRNPYENSSSILATWGGAIIDTDQLRRQKGVIAVVFEVPVGTLDSSRQRTRAPLRPNPADEGTSAHHHHHHHQQQQPQQQPLPPPTTATVHFQDEKRRHRTDFVDEGYDNAEYDAHYPPFIHDEYPPSPYYTSHEAPPELAPVYVPPPPEISDESGLSEKERIRRAEQRLLPSQPQAEASTSTGPSGGHNIRHQGPPGVEEEEEDLYNAEDQQPQPRRRQSPSSSSAVRPPPPHPLAPATTQEAMATAPSLDDVEAPPPWGAHTTSPPPPGEDKLERERRRLLAEASAPPDFPDDDAAFDSGAASASAPPIGASASASASTSAYPASASASASAPATAPPNPDDDDDFAPSAPVIPEEQDGYHHDRSYSIGGTAGAGLDAPAPSGSSSTTLEQQLLSPHVGPSSSGRQHPAEPLPRYVR